MAPTKSIANGFRKALSFSGRDSRAEYWWFSGFTTLTLFGTAILVDSLPPGTQTVAYKLWLLGLVVFTVLYLSSTFRRLHDTGRSGFQAFEPLLVFAIYGAVFVITAMGFLNSEDSDAAGWLIGILALNALLSLAFLITMARLVFRLTRPSEPGPNKYGPNPNEVSS
ncbi:DUF805 domain-containing protein [Shimia sp. FJ5]|uniref:DUF805 domain-containing protein n=1 Tax=Shimia sp. FJ5 TaxID=3079054 RepID=UPI002625B5F0|nr:DUF805 domain-containing protein [Shimia sp. FJ5]MDV4145066.1 DUF805 domain-containing protein [Shimia sp. FJ5]